MDKIARHVKSLAAWDWFVGKSERTQVAVRRTVSDSSSLTIALAYLKGKDAESEEAQEHANSSSLAL